MPRVVAFSDVHGAYDELVDLLTDLELIDDHASWIGGVTHLVSTGDLLDRGADSRKVMDLLMELQQQALAAGGRVHVTLGNHEIMNVYGDLRYVIADEYLAYADEADTQKREKFRSEHDDAEFEKKYPPGFFTHRAMFEPDGKYGAWLLKRPFVIVINGVAFTHGGLSEKVIAQDLSQINNTLRSELVGYLKSWLPLREAGIAPPGGGFWDRFDVVGAWLNQAMAEDAVAPENLKVAAQEFLKKEKAWIFGDDNPLWYRDMVRCHPLTEIDVTKAALESIGAQRVVVGHTPTGGQVQSRFDGRVIELDTGMAPYYGGRPTALILENDETTVFYADDESRGKPLAEVRQVGPRPRGLSDSDIERLLLEAEVVHEEDVGMGVTKPTRVTLQQGDIKIRALFRTEDTSDEVRGKRAYKNRLKNLSDTFKSDIAAYQLDRIMDLNLIPVTVIREHNDKQGIFQFWVENSITELERKDNGISMAPNCSLRDQYDLMNTFDVLIYNEDRNLSNILYEKNSWDVLLIDHSRAFRTKTGRPAKLAKVNILLNDEIVSRLKRLQPDLVYERLSGVLSRGQIKSLLRRKDQILKEAKRRGL